MLGLSPISGAPISAWYVPAVEPATPSPTPSGGGEVGGWPFAAKRRKTENDDAFLIAVLM